VITLTLATSLIAISLQLFGRLIHVAVGIRIVMPLLH
jgi:hypothetical protein